MVNVGDKLKALVDRPWMSNVHCGDIVTITQINDNVIRFINDKGREFIGLKKNIHRYFELVENDINTDVFVKPPISTLVPEKKRFVPSIDLDYEDYECWNRK